MKKAKQMGSKVLAIFLCVMMLIPLLPTFEFTASAAETDPVDSAVEKLPAPGGNEASTDKSEVTASDTDQWTWYMSEMTENGTSFTRMEKLDAYQDSGTYGNKTDDAGFSNSNANSSSYFTLNAANTNSLKSMSYMVIRYRTGGTKNGAAQGTPYIVLRFSSGNKMYLKLPKAGYGTAGMQTVVIDIADVILKSGVNVDGSAETVRTSIPNDVKLKYVTIVPKLVKGQYFDCEYVAFFDTYDKALACSNGMVERVSGYAGGTSVPNDGVTTTNACPGTAAAHKVLSRKDYSSYYRYTKEYDHHPDAIYGDTTADGSWGDNCDGSTTMAFTMGVSTNLDYTNILVLSYRTGGTNGGKITSADAVPYVFVRCNNVNKNEAIYMELPQSGYGSSDFQTVIIDLTKATAGNVKIQGVDAGGTLANAKTKDTPKVNYINVIPKLAQGQYMDIEYMAVFNTVEDARNYITIQTTAQGVGRKNVLTDNVTAELYGENGALALTTHQKQILTDGALGNNASGEDVVLKSKYWTSGTEENYPSSIADSYRPQGSPTNALTVDGATKNYWYYIQFTLESAKTVNGFTAYMQGYNKYVVDRSFDLLVSADGVNWQTAYSADTNNADYDTAPADNAYAKHYSSIDYVADETATGNAADGVAYVNADFTQIAGVKYIAYACEDYAYSYGNMTAFLTEIEVYERTSITMPITIRDYAADGMLFEWNERPGVFVTRYDPKSWGGSCKYLQNPYDKTVQDAGGSKFQNTNGFAQLETYNDDTGKKAYSTLTIGGAYTGGEIRYIAIRGRLTAAPKVNPTIYYRKDGDDANTSAVKYQFTDANVTAWNQADHSYLVIDMGAKSEAYTNTAIKYVTIYTGMATGKSMIISDIAFFTTKEAAQLYVNGKQAGNTLGYGLLAYDGNGHDESEPINTGTQISNGTWNATTAPSKMDVMLNSGAQQYLEGALVRYDLVQGELGANGKPVYTQATVDYLAQYMQKTLPQAEKVTHINSYKDTQTLTKTNLWHVQGVKLFDDNYNYVGISTSATKDLSDVIRYRVGTTLGNYADAKAKFDAGELTLETISSYYEAAYWLLHSTFFDNDGYGQTDVNYKGIELVEVVDENGKIKYVFNSGYDNAVYDHDNGIIYNSQTETATLRKKDDGVTDAYVRGNPQYANTFNPLNNRLYGNSGDTYGVLYGSTSDQENYYSKTNYNLTLEGHGQFVYHANDNLFFTFTGDDDVYLYINGKRVLDLGGAHAIAKGGVYLNTVTEACGLVEGETANFDFFYMERHGSASNFSIETNIQLGVSEMELVKEGFQNGGTTGYMGDVDPNVPVSYQFDLTNEGQQKLQNIGFSDPNIGASFSATGVALNNAGQAEGSAEWTTLNDLNVTVYDKDNNTIAQIISGSVIKWPYIELEDGYYNGYTNDSVIDEHIRYLLQYGLDPHERIVIYGMKYQPSLHNAWVVGDSSDTFTNTVYATAYPMMSDGTAEKLETHAVWAVTKAEFVFNPIHRYEWVGKGVTISKQDIVNIVKETEPTANLTTSSEFILSTAGGTLDKVTVATDGISYTSYASGAFSFFVTAGGYGPVRIDIYSYNVADNAVVLDYGLAADITVNEIGRNDVLFLNSNPYNAVVNVVNMAAAGTTTTTNSVTGTYGDFSYANSTVTYTPKGIINAATDKVRIYVRVAEKGVDFENNVTGIEMYQDVTIAPASITYYEDNIGDLTYIDNGNTQWQTITGNDVGSKQDGDQSTAYGSDSNYAVGKENILLSEGRYLDASNGNVHYLATTEKTADVMTFSFTGTGFDLISAVTIEDFPLLIVKVYKKGTNQIVRFQPVIAENRSEDLYQIPLVSITGMDHGEYDVAIQSSAVNPKLDNLREVIIDGIRVYDPLTSTEATKYYTAAEDGAVRINIRDLIVEKAGQTHSISYVNFASNNGELVSANGTVIIENPDGGTLISVTGEDAANYIKNGPNNEVYLTADAGNGSVAISALAFYARPTGDTNGTTIQVGVHRKAGSNTENKEVLVVYGSNAMELYNRVNQVVVNSATEQYVTIDVSRLTPDANGYYKILFGVCDIKEEDAVTAIEGEGTTTVGGSTILTEVDEDYNPFLSVTNIKVKGYVLSAAYIGADEIDVSKDAMLADMYSLNIFANGENAGENVNADLNIYSAEFLGMGSNNVASVSVTASDNAESIVITDENGNEVVLTNCVKVVSNGIATFTATFEAEDGKTYNVNVCDADGKYASAAETVTVSR